MRFNKDASATYKKLADGSWGVWTDLDLKPGKTVTVTTAGGETKTEKLRKLLGHSRDGDRRFAIHRTGEW